jgi:predicted phosphoribosyltransferase
MGPHGDPSPPWPDRTAAGRELADRLATGLGRDGSSILVALPRGGVPVAAVIAHRLHLPLTTWSVRKLALPTAKEFAIGAIAPGGVVLWDPASSRRLLRDLELRSRILEAESRELLRRQQLFGDASPELLRGRTLVVVDDGIATGLTARAALQSLRQLGPRRLILAVPVVAERALGELQPLLDAAVVLAAPENLVAVGCHYERFEQLEDADVLELLAGCRRPPIA